MTTADILGLGKKRQINKENEGFAKRFRKMMETPEAINRFVGKSWKQMNTHKKGLRILTIGSIYKYCYYFLGFLIWADYTTETFYQQCKEWQNAEDARDLDALDELIIGYQDYYMESHGTTFSVTDNIYCSFKKFCYTNRIPLEYFERQPPDDEFEKEFAYMNVEQVNQALDQHPSKKVTSLILFAKDSMMRVSDLALLKFDKLRDLLNDPEQRFYQFDYRPIKTYKKTKMEASPVIGPDAIDSLFEWFAERKKLGIQMTDDDYVFCSTRNQRAHTTKDGIERVEVKMGAPMQSSAVSSTIQYWFDKADHQILKGQKRKPTPHSLIKLSSTDLYEAGVKELYLNVFRGKKGVGTIQNYVKPPEDVLIKAFSEGYHAISLTDTTQTDELERVKAENTELQVKTNSLEKRLQALEDNPKSLKSSFFFPEYPEFLKHRS